MPEKLPAGLSFKTATLQKHKHILAHQGTLAKADARLMFIVHEGFRLGACQDPNLVVSGHFELTYDSFICENIQIIVFLNPGPDEPGLTALSAKTFK